MFEKEAEEGLNKRLGTYGYIRKQDCYLNYTDGFKDGAEYGYNKGFEFGVKSNEKVNQIVTNEWHDLRKNPNDLPENMGGGLSRTVVNQIGTPCHYSYDFKCWQNWSYIKIETPVAWCDIPKFKEIE